MTQTEINKKAVDSVMALEDAKDIFEAIGDMNDDFSNLAPEEPMEYSADDLLTVNPNDADPMGTIPDMSGASAEMDDETKKFVVDQFAEKAMQLSKDTIDMSDIAPIAAVIQGENGIQQNVSGFLEKIIMDTKQRLSAQNVSEAQPNGTAIDFNNDDTMDAGADINAMGGAEGIMGMEEAPGGIEEPSLDANMGPEPGMDNGMGAPMDDGSEFGGDMGGDAAMGAADDMGGDGFDSGAIDDAMSAEGLGEDNGDMDMGAEVGDDDLGGEDAGAESAGMTDDTSAFGDEGNEGSEGEGEDDQMASPDDMTSDEPEDDTAFESNMEKAKAKLEAIRGKYIQDRAASKIKSIVESFQERQSRASKKAKLEAIVANYKKSEENNRVNAKLESIVSNYAASVQADKESQVQAQLESIANDYFNSERAKSRVSAAKRILNESIENTNGSLKAKLESISGRYHSAIRNEANTKAKLESILASYKKSQKAQNTAAKLESIAKNYKNSDEYKAMIESSSKKATPSLKDKLDAIVGSIR